MGMNHNSACGDSQDEVARLFQQRVRRGEFTQVGVDILGDPLYILTESLRSPLKGLYTFLVSDFSPLFTIRPAGL